MLVVFHKCCTYIMAAVFIFAALDKYGSLWGFTADLYEYRVVGSTTGAVLAHLIPGIELFVGISVLHQSLRKAAAICMASLLAIFLLAQIAALYQSLDISCGCFESPEYVVGSVSIVRNIALLVVALTTGWLSKADLYNKPDSIA